ncbi:MAG TPA: AMP-binding protein, partial [Oligoflexia bacterium]|nr:AMP-binding protein [Oligoflexia bacterium]
MLEKIPLLGLSAAEAAGAELPHVLYLEDFEQTFTWPRKLYYAAAALVLPCFAIERLFFVRKFSRDDIATVIFSSGSTGEPKGVLLSHANISANIKSIYEIYQFKADDCVAGVLPFFHSFGFTGTLWLPLLGGFRAAYHHNPLDAAAVGRLVEEHQATMLMSTPTFLLGYIRRCGPEQFKSLRYVMTGAEKLKERIAESFVEKFGIVPREGYGCTELSPLAIANIEGYSGKDTSGRDNVQQVGQKLGTVGHPIPGVAVRIVDPDRFSPLPVGAEGLLLVRGANVMRGYLGHPERTKEVMRDGWYVTGDIARIDEDGFVTITDRLSRFSKIAGEMVPHVRIEEAIHKALGEHDNAHVVTAVADEKRGEKLVVLST